MIKQRKRRVVLLAAGLALSLAAGLGLYAATSDTASVGRFSPDSEALASSADLQVTDVGGIGMNCTTHPGPWNENFVGVTTWLTDIDPGEERHSPYCLRNVGAQTVTVLTDTENVTDLEEGPCTGDEGDVDATCAAAGDPGELADDLYVVVTTGNSTNCQAGGPRVLNDAVPAAVGITDTDPTASTSFTLAPGEVTCVVVTNGYSSSTPVLEVVEGQSDEVSYDVRFTGSV